jgi:hypothetical protein
MDEHLLHESITTAAASIILLQLYKLELAKWGKDSLQVLLRDVEVDVANIKTVEWDAAGAVGAALGIADLPVLLGLGKLDNDGDA